MQSYSQDLRDRVLRALERGDSPTVIARRFEVSRAWVYDVTTRWEKDGLRQSFRVGGHRVSAVAPAKADLLAWITAQPDLTLAELCARLAERDIRIKPCALWHQLNKWGLSFKTNAARQRASTRGRAGGTRRVDRPAAWA